MILSCYINFFMEIQVKCFPTPLSGHTAIFHFFLGGCLGGVYYFSLEPENFVYNIKNQIINFLI